MQKSISQPANLVAFAFLLIAFLTGIASSFQLPTLSLFLSQEIQVSPMWVGMFYSINAVIGIILSQILAKYSDKQEDRRKVMFFCCLIAIIGCLLFAFSRNYYILLLFGTTLLGLGSASNPQIFAFAREYAENTQRESVIFITIMRTQISLAWIIGPPLSFSIALNWGFNYMYLVAASAFFFCAMITMTLLPKVPRLPQRPKTQHNSVANHKKSVVFLFISCFLLWTCNSMYLINMPLYLIHELKLPEKLAGILMGTAAGLEIPVMLLAGVLTKYISKKQLMFTALFAGFIFYLCLLSAQQTWLLVTLQILNAVCIGILATVGMIYFQDLMPNQMGSATTLFSNTAKSSWILGGPIAGALTEFYGHNAVFYVAVIFIVISLGCLKQVKSV